VGWVCFFIIRNEEGKEERKVNKRHNEKRCIEHYSNVERTAPMLMASSSHKDGTQPVPVLKLAKGGRAGDVVGCSAALLIALLGVVVFVAIKGDAC
jgi:hypothetical protein